MPVGPYTLWPLNTKKSQPISLTSTGIWGMLWAPSTKINAPCSWAVRAISFTGLTVPRTLETCVTQTNLVLGVKSFSYSSNNSSPLSFMGITFSVIPLRLHSSCQGTILEWCSMDDTMISSPSRNNSPSENATRLMPSVVPRVKIISSVFSAPMNCLTVSRASSRSSVAFSERKWTPRCTLALQL